MLRRSILVTVLLLAGCGQTWYSQGRSYIEGGQYDRAVALYYRILADNPESMQAWQGLGIAFYEQGNYDKAEDALKQANNIQIDARTSLYLGLSAEFQGATEKAINAYRAALAMSADSETKNRLRAHLDKLIHDRMMAEATTALADEAAINADTIPDNTIAVVDFDASYIDSSMRPLGTALAEFTARDLGKVKQLQVVERMKIDAIMQEIELGQTDMIDRSTAPRLGRLVGGKHIVTGSLAGIGDKSLRIDGLVVTTTDSSTIAPQPTEEPLDKLFRAQKQFVFNILDGMGIDITADERDMIAEVPTESYLALLAYGRGLDYYRRGMLPQAEAAFNEAAAADPGFSEARGAAATTSAAIELGGANHSTESFEVASTSGLETPTFAGAPTAGLGSRLNRTLRNSGGLPNPERPNPVTRPPVTDETSTVVIQGDLNGGN